MTISNLPLLPGMDFELLKREAISFIQQMKGEWTDFNTHDPGVTILENLCYAITDLSYRLSFDIEDILAYPEEEKGSYHFFSPKAVLMNSPVTINDYRKLLIDIYGVKNAWIEPDNSLRKLFTDEANRKISSSDLNTGNVEYLGGFYKILIRKDGDHIHDLDILESVKSTFNDNRNLCETIGEISVLPSETITVRSYIDISETSVAEDVLARIVFYLDCFIAPNVNFYSFTEMIEKGVSVEEILCGPKLDNGFIDDSELAVCERKSELHISDLIHIILDVEGVKNIRFLKVSSSMNTNEEEWAFDLSAQCAPNIKGVVNIAENGDITLLKNNIPCEINKDILKKKYEEIKKSNTREISGNNPSALKGKYRNLLKYPSVLNDFPPVFGVGKEKLPESIPPEHKARVKQLKAYLTFFDEILFGAFTQISHIKDLFSVNQKYSEYIKPMRTPYDDELFDQDSLNSTEENPANKEFDIEMKNRILDHMIARFGEHYPRYFSSNSEKVVEDKIIFLKELPFLSLERGMVPNFFNDDKSGLQKVLIRKLGLRDSEQDFHIVENILLCNFDSEEKKDVITLKPEYFPDPFSFRLSFVFNGNMGRFSIDHFRKLTEQYVFSETPVHLKYEIYWLEDSAFKEFSNIYEQFTNDVFEKGFSSFKTISDIMKILGIQEDNSNDISLPQKDD